MLVAVETCFGRALLSDSEKDSLSYARAHAWKSIQGLIFAASLHLESNKAC